MLKRCWDCTELGIFITYTANDADLERWLKSLSRVQTGDASAEHEVMNASHHQRNNSDETTGTTGTTGITKEHRIMEVSEESQIRTIPIDAVPTTIPVDAVYKSNGDSVQPNKDNVDGDSISHVHTAAKEVEGDAMVKEGTKELVSSALPSEASSSSSVASTTSAASIAGAAIDASMTGLPAPSMTGLPVPLPSMTGLPVPTPVPIPFTDGIHTPVTALSPAASRKNSDDDTHSQPNSAAPSPHKDKDNKQQGRGTVAIPTASPVGVRDPPIHKHSHSGTHHSQAHAARDEEEKRRRALLKIAEDKEKEDKAIKQKEEAAHIFQPVCNHYKEQLLQLLQSKLNVVDMCPSCLELDSTKSIEVGFHPKASEPKRTGK